MRVRREWLRTVEADDRTAVKIFERCALPGSVSCQGPFGWMMTLRTSKGERANDVDLPDAASFASAKLGDGTCTT
jgi:hypothetical protein